MRRLPAQTNVSYFFVCFTLKQTIPCLPRNLVTRGFHFSIILLLKGKSYIYFIQKIEQVKDLAGWTKVQTLMIAKLYLEGEALVWTNNDTRVNNTTTYFESKGKSQKSQMKKKKKKKSFPNEIKRKLN
jgi:hypothetical protein